MLLTLYLRLTYVGREAIYVVKRMDSGASLRLNPELATCQLCILWQVTLPPHAQFSHLYNVNIVQQGYDD